MNNFDYWYTHDKEALQHFLSCDCERLCGFNGLTNNMCFDFIMSEFEYIVDYLGDTHKGDVDKSDIDKAREDLQDACDKLTNADLPEQLRLANNRIAALERRIKQLESQKEYYRELFSEMSTLAHEMSRIAERFGDA